MFEGLRKLAFVDDKGDVVNRQSDVSDTLGAL